MSKVIWISVIIVLLVIAGVIVACRPTTACTYVYGHQPAQDTLVIDRKEWTLSIGNGPHGFRSPRIVVRYSFTLRDGQAGSYTNVSTIGPDLDLYHGTIEIEKAGDVPVAAVFHLDHSATGLSQSERELFDGKRYTIKDVMKAAPPF